MSFKSCYPYFKKIPDLSVFDTWVLGQYDTCTFYTDDGRQAFGVCCDDPPKKNDFSPIIAGVDDNVVVSSNVYSNWPPPFITHPPNHAAPTHPTVSGEFSNLDLLPYTHITIIIICYRCLACGYNTVSYNNETPHKSSNGTVATANTNTFNIITGFSSNDKVSGTK